MSIRDLKAEISRNEISIPSLAEKIGINKKTMYSRLKGETEFTREEIVKISKSLNLNNEKIIAIFLTVRFPKRNNLKNKLWLIFLMFR